MSIFCYSKKDQTMLRQECWASLEGRLGVLPEENSYTLPAWCLMNELLYQIEDSLDSPSSYWSSWSSSLACRHSYRSPASSTVRNGVTFTRMVLCSILSVVRLLRPASFCRPMKLLVCWAVVDLCAGPFFLLFYSSWYRWLSINDLMLVFWTQSLSRGDGLAFYKIVFPMEIFVKVWFMMLFGCLGRYLYVIPSLQAFQNSGLIFQGALCVAGSAVCLDLRCGIRLRDSKLLNKYSFRQSQRALRSSSKGLPMMPNFFRKKLLRILASYSNLLTLLNLKLNTSRLLNCQTPLSETRLL